MRSVDIVLDNRRVLPGGTLTGKVIVRTDKEFECNRVVLKVVSKERTVVGSGKHRRVDEKKLVTQVFRLSEGRTIGTGATPFPFSFDVPRGLPPTYDGYYGYIKHTVEGVVEVDWALDPKLKTEYRVIQDRPPISPEIFDSAALSESGDGLHVQLNEDSLRLDSGILVRFKVDNKDRMRAVRLEIIKREDAKCDYKHPTKKTTVRRKYHELNPDDWGRWLEMRIGEDWQYHLPFKSQLFNISYYLKVTLEVGWSLDPSIEIPVSIVDSTPSKDVLDDIASDLGFTDWKEW